MAIQDFITGIQHVGIPAGNIETSIEFYRGLGFECALRPSDDAAGCPVAFMSLKNLTVELYEDGKAAMKNGAVDHVALDVTDIEKAFELVKAGGYELLDREIQSLPFWERGVRFFTIVGPNHEKIEFSQRL
jgi:catechol 2,3-dioxygenase-like lactoylglutathione lyase family enzyme